MSEENKKEEVETIFAKSLDELNKLRGKVKAFMLLALTEEPSEGKEDAVRGINAVGGKMWDLVKLFENISPEIKSAAEIKGLVDILGKVFEENEESESEKRTERNNLALSQHKWLKPRGGHPAPADKGKQW